jgi:hypothetical protein
MTLRATRAGVFGLASSRDELLVQGGALLAVLGTAVSLVGVGLWMDRHGPPPRDEETFERRAGRNEATSRVDGWRGESAQKE